MTTVRPSTVTSPGAAERAFEAAVGALQRQQSAAGWWKGELETNVTIDAEDLFMRHFLGVPHQTETVATATWIRSRQRSDGTWPTYYGGPGDLSTTIEAYLALRLAGDPPDAAHMRSAIEFVRDSGGPGAARVFTRIWLALMGLWSWGELPVLPPEIVLLPPWVPLNVYDFACWARQTIVALAVLSAYRPVRPLPLSLDELAVAEQRSAAPWTIRTWKGRFELLDRFLHVYERRPVSFLRKLALSRAEQWILERQEADGCWGGIQPPWVYSLMALHVRGYPLDHPVMRAGLAGFERYTTHDEAGRRVEACQSPVWDTALALVALADAGVPSTDPGVRRAVDWLVDEQISAVGDWAVRRPGLEPGGWAFEFDNDHYPDIDDTAEVVMALWRCGPAPATEPRLGAALDRARRWVVGMQSSDGGWGAFDADNTRSLCAELPFCDFGELTDPPSADVTAHVVEMLAMTDSHALARQRGVVWLLRAQEDDGSWFGRWGANHLYGTAQVVPALVAAGVSTGHPSVAKALAWIRSRQNPDGGWGEDLRSYEEGAWRGRGESTPSQTSWAILALLAAGDRSTAERGVQWLAEMQRPDGTWDEPQYTGTGFPGDFYINYHLYRQVFPVMALGRYVRLHSDDVGGSRG